MESACNIVVIIVIISLFFLGEKEICVRVCVCEMEFECVFFLGEKEKGSLEDNTGQKTTEVGDWTSRLTGGVDGVVIRCMQLHILAIIFIFCFYRILLFSLH